ncbi:hypothetical protein V8E55_005904 [Tylopilus felleus]
MDRVHKDLLLKITDKDKQPGIGTLQREQGDEEIADTICKGVQSVNSIQVLNLDLVSLVEEDFLVFVIVPAILDIHLNLLVCKFVEILGDAWDTWHPGSVMGMGNPHGSWVWVLEVATFHSYLRALILYWEPPEIKKRHEEIYQKMAPGKPRNARRRHKIQKWICFGSTLDPWVKPTFFQPTQNPTPTIMGVDFCQGQLCGGSIVLVPLGYLAPVLGAWGTEEDVEPLLEDARQLDREFGREPRLYRVLERAEGEYFTPQRGENWPKVYWGTLGWIQ